MAEQAGGTSPGRVSLVPVEPHPSLCGATRLAAVREPGSPLTQVPGHLSRTSHLVLRELLGQDTLEPLERRKRNVRGIRVNVSEFSDATAQGGKEDAPVPAGPYPYPPATPECDVSQECVRLGTEEFKKKIS